MKKEQSPGVSALRSQAAQVLADMMEAGKVSAGDLIKILGMEDAAPDEASAARDFAIRVTDE